MKLPDIGPVNEYTTQQAINRLQACADAAFFRHAIEKKYGGLGDSFRSLTEHHQALGEQVRDPGLLLAINAHIWGSVFTLLRFGDKQQKAHWLAPLLAGDVIGGHAITEPQAGSNAQMIETHYHQTKHAYVLNGHKRFITNTPIAGMMIVYAKLANTDEISAFILTPEDGGADFLDTPTVKGCATASMGDIMIKDCAVPKSRLLGKPGAGGTMIQLALERERAFIFAGIAGVMQWQLKQVINFARSRTTGGQKLGRHQAISHKIAEMKMRIDTTKLWLAQCANLLDSGKRITVQSAQTKLYASEAFMQTSLDTVHIFGAAGLTAEFTNLVEDAMAGRLMAGSSELQKNIIATMLGLDAK